MGAWSAALFGSDIACDVRDAYLELLRSGKSASSASKQLISDFSEERADEQDGPPFWLALAAVQHEHGRLQPGVKAKALKVIESGGDLKTWEEEEERFVRQRKRVLQQLRRRLQSAQLPPKAVRIERQPPDSKRPKQTWKRGELFAYRKASGDLVLLLTEYATVDKPWGHVPYFAVLDWKGKTLPAPAVIRKLPFLRNTVKVYPYRKQPPPWDRLERLDMSRKLTGLIRVERGMFIGMSRVVNWKELDDELDSMFATVQSIRKLPR